MPRSELEALLAWVEAWLEGTPPANVWIGATVVNQEEADRDIPKLLAVPATRRFLSIEPMLGPVNLRALHIRDRLTLDALSGCHRSSAGPGGTINELLAALPPLPGRLPGIDWVIVGGESGPQARPIHPDWVRSLRDQCVSAGVPFFFKQWGEWTPGENVQRHRGIVATADRWGEVWCISREDLARTDEHRDDAPDLYRVGKTAAGRLLDGRTWDEVPR